VTNQPVIYDGEFSGISHARSAVDRIARNLPSPIPNMVRDTEELRTFINDMQVVPVFCDNGNTGLGFLNLLFKLGRNSPSHASCIKSKANLSFGRINPATRQSGFFTNINAAEGATAQGIADLLKSIGLKSSTIIGVTKAVYQSFEECGNAYLKMRVAVVGGEAQVSFEPIDYRYCLYLKEEKKGVRYLLRALGEWTAMDIARKMYEVLPASTPENFNFQRNGSVYETILHVKNITFESAWYGSFPVMAAFNSIFMEWQLTDHIVREAANDWLARIIFFIEQEESLMNDAPDATVAEGQTSAALVRRTIERAVLKGSQSATGVAVMEYPNGTKEPLIKELPPMTNEKFHEYADKNATDKVFAMHNWSKVMAGWNAAASSIGGNVFADEFNIRNQTVIKPLQEEYASLWGHIFDAVAVLTERPDLNNAGIIFETLYSAPDANTPNV